MAVVPKVNLIGLAAAILKSGDVEVANVNVAVALCLIVPEVPVIATL